MSAFSSALELYAYRMPAGSFILSVEFIPPGLLSLSDVYEYRDVVYR